MKTTHLKKLLSIFLFVTFSTLSFAQDIAIDKINDRYIIIDNLANYFETKEDGSIYVEFTLYNIYETESSKPIHLAVNDLPNVVKFTIKSNSENYENQRGCFLNINSQSYKDTFYSALKAIQIKYVKLNDELITLDQFYSKIN